MRKMTIGVMLVALIGVSMVVWAQTSKEWNDWGDDAYYDGDYVRAIECYTKLIEQEPDLAIGYQFRGWAYYGLGRFEDAIADYTTAVEMDPEYRDLYIDRGKAYGALRRSDEAIADYTTAIDLDPNMVNGYAGRAWEYYKIRDFTRALEDIGIGMELDADCGDCLYTRGLIYRDTGKERKARADLTRACDLGLKKGCDALFQLGE